MFGLVRLAMTFRSEHWRSGLEQTWFVFVLSIVRRRRPFDPTEHGFRVAKSASVAITRRVSVFGGELEQSDHVIILLMRMST